ncbi:GDSL-type esterase/lipase family protein [Actinorugispora endophytica]|nr:GDSL-type esterase/lipase family protein [Actinorugispora endophytica]
MAVTMVLLRSLTGDLLVEEAPAPEQEAPTGGWTAPGGTVRIMVAGDSFVQGSSGDFTWRYRLWEHLTGSAAPDVDFVGPRADLFDVGTGEYGDDRYAVADFDTDHAGVWGSTTGNVAERIGAETVGAEPHYLLLMVGANDIVGGSTASEALEGVRDIVTAARVARGDVRVVLGELPPMWGTDHDQEVNTVIGEYNAGLPVLAGQLTGAESPVVVARSAADYAPADDNWDTTHPNARGEVKIAAAFADALAEPLGLGEPYPRPLPDVPVGPRTAPVPRAERVADGVRLSWDPVPGATRYEVSRRRAAPDPDEWVLAGGAVEGAGGQERGAVVTGLFAGAAYEFRVRSFKGGDAGRTSEVLRFELDDDPPPAPAGVRVADGALEWEGVREATHYAVWRRPLECGTGPDPSCAPADDGPVGTGTGWEAVAVVRDAEHWTIAPGPAPGYELAVRAHRDYIEGGVSEPVREPRR